ncbi:MAG: hypothetical protein QXE68_05335 [Sulfolobales archaeon]
MDVADPAQFMYPESILNALVGTSRLLGYEMSERIYLIFIDKPVLGIIPYNERYKVVVRYLDQNVLGSC